MIQWYITHTCNLACSNCLSFNNYRFKGHFSWEQSRLRTEKWSELLTSDDITVIGGEPLLHPQIDQWVVELRQLFPLCEDFKVCTNGTRLRYHEPSQFHRWFELGVILEIHSHSDQHWQTAFQDLDAVFNCYDYDIAVEKNHEENTEAHRLIINNQTAALIFKSDRFAQNSILSDRSKLTFHRNDPLRAHRSCPIKDCHYVLNGFLYKCGPVTVGRDLVKQFPVEESAAQLLNSYSAIDPFDTDVLNQLQKLNQPIPQCSLCPVFDDFKNQVNIPLTPDQTKPII